MGTRAFVGNVYTGGVAALAALVANKVVHGAWQATTGEKAPEPSDPETPLLQAVLWVALSAFGLGLIQVLANRFAARRWAAFSDEPVSLRKASFKL